MLCKRLRQKERERHTHTLTLRERERERVSTSKPQVHRAGISQRPGKLLLGED